MSDTYTIAIDRETPDDRYKVVRRAIGNHILENNRILLAASSWQGFQESGKGYLFTNLLMQNDLTLTVNPEVGLIYVAEGSQRWELARASEARSRQTEEYQPFYNAVETYHPRYEFMVIIGFESLGNHPSEFWSHERPPTEAIPIKAAATVRRRPNEFSELDLTLSKQILVEIRQGGTFTLWLDEYYPRIERP